MVSCVSQIPFGTFGQLPRRLASCWFLWFCQLLAGCPKKRLQSPRVAKGNQKQKGRLTELWDLKGVQGPNSGPSGPSGRLERTSAAHPSGGPGDPRPQRGGGALQRTGGVFLRENGRPQGMLRLIIFSTGKKKKNQGETWLYVCLSLGAALEGALFWVSFQGKQRTSFGASGHSRNSKRCLMFGSKVWGRRQRHMRMWVCPKFRNTQIGSVPFGYRKSLNEESMCDEIQGAG